MIVKTLPHNLSNDAQDLYVIAARNGRTIQGDTWEQEERIGKRLVKPSLSAVQELVDAGLATHSVSNWDSKDHHYLWVTLVHGYYSNLDSEGDRGMYIEVYTIDPTRDKESLLLTLRGATLRTTDNRGSRYGIPVWRVSVKHDTATDFEHDSAYLADLLIENPVTTEIDHNGTTIIGHLRDARYYEYGTQIVTDDTEWCDYERCGDTHPFVEYMPKESEKQSSLNGAMVKVVINDVRLVDEAGKVKTADQ